jgi:hypothetical protein
VALKPAGRYCGVLELRHGSVGAGVAFVLAMH